MMPDENPLCIDCRKPLPRHHPDHPASSHVGEVKEKKHVPGTEEMHKNRCRKCFNRKRHEAGLNHNVLDCPHPVCLEKAKQHRNDIAIAAQRAIQQARQP